MENLQALTKWSALRSLAIPLTRVIGLQTTFVMSFHAAFLVCAAFAAIGIFTDLARGNVGVGKKAE